jgi:hypothetical protein
MLPPVKKFTFSQAKKAKQKNYQGTEGEEACG